MLPVPEDERNQYTATARMATKMMSPTMILFFFTIRLPSEF